VGPHEIWKRGSGRERLVGPDSDYNWVSAHYRIGTRKILFFFKSFYNLHTNLNLNFDDFYSHNKT
jgi:hypothetical protein